MYRLTNTDSILRIADGALIPADPANADYAAYLAWVAEGNTPEPYEPPALSDAEQIAALQAAVQARLDAFAATRYYGSILSACSYATDPDPKFAADGQYCVVARSQTWAVCNQKLNDFAAGLCPMPTEAELIALLPALAWPGAAA